MKPQQLSKQFKLDVSKVYNLVSKFKEFLRTQEQITQLDQ